MYPVGLWGDDRDFPTVLRMCPGDYRSHGAPLESYALTRADDRRQEQTEQMAEYARDIVASAPPLTVEQRSKIAALFNGRTPDHELMRWRVRLYCGHIAETRAHCEHRRPSESMVCPECGLDPATVVAYLPLGRVSEPPHPRPPATPVVSRSARRSAEQKRIDELEQEVARLRACLGKAQPPCPPERPSRAD